jgi:hypothetical protein
MKLIKITSKGSLHFELSDGRIGTVSESGYVRVNTKYLNYHHNKRLFYQINKKTSYANENNPLWVNFKRELVPSHIDRIKLLYAFNQKNCQDEVNVGGN